MSIINFVKAMLPRVQKSTIEEDVRTTIKELESITIPRFKASGEHFRVMKIEDETLLAVSKQFYDSMQVKFKGPNMIFDMGQAYDRLYQNLQHISKLVSSLLEADILNEGLTVKKAHLIRAVSSMSFASSFGLDFLDYVLLLETNKRTKEVEPIDPYRKKYFDARYQMFFRAINDYSMEPEKFTKVMLDIPDAVITPKNAASLSAVFEPRKMDPFGGIGPSGFTGNPIYHIRLAISSWQTARYEAWDEKKKLLELRLLQLQELESGKKNPQLDQEIIYLEKRISKLEKNMREVEEDLGIEKY